MLATSSLAQHCLASMERSDCGESVLFIVFIHQRPGGRPDPVLTVGPYHFNMEQENLREGSEVQGGLLLEEAVYFMLYVYYTSYIVQLYTYNIHIEHICAYCLSCKNVIAMKMVILLNTGGVFVFGGASDQIGLLSLLDIRLDPATPPVFQCSKGLLMKSTKTQKQRLMNVF